MHLKSKEGYILVELIYILALLSFFSSILMSITMNNLKREKINPYINRQIKSYSFEVEMEFLEEYLTLNTAILETLKKDNVANKKINLRDNVFLEYDKNLSLFLLRKDRDYILLKEDGAKLLPYSYRY